MTASKFAMMGDWNGTPGERGKYSCDWVADSIPGAELFVPDMGKHGRIDMAISNATIQDLGRVAGKNPELDRLPGGGSDHGLCVGKIKEPGKNGDWLKFAFWNAERDRKGREILEMIHFLRGVIQKYDLDFVCLQESQQYHKELRNLGRTLNMDLIASPVPGIGHNTILVSNRLKATRPSFPLVSKVGWITEGGAKHPPLHMTTVTINGWLRLACIHQVPSVRVDNGVVKGPPARRVVWMQSMQSFVNFGRIYSFKED